MTRQVLIDLSDKKFVDGAADEYSTVSWHCSFTESDGKVNLDAILRIQDCFKTVTLGFDVWEKFDDKDNPLTEDFKRELDIRIAKADSLLKSINELKSNLEQAASQYDGIVRGDAKKRKKRRHVSTLLSDL